MKKLLAIALIAMLAGSAFAQVTWIGNAYLIVNGTDFYNISASADLVTPTLPASLTLTAGSVIGFQIQQWPDGESGGFGYDANVHYSLDGVAWSDATIAFSENKDSNGWYEQFDVITITEAMDGATLSLAFFSSTDGTVANANAWDSGSPDYSVTLNVTPAAAVPEPATMSLLGLGALALAVRRKLRK